MPEMRRRWSWRPCVIALGFGVACEGSARLLDRDGTGHRAAERLAGPAAVRAESNGPEHCDIESGDSKPGNHNRRVFEDTTTGLKGYRDGAGRVVISAKYAAAWEFSVGGVAAVVDGRTPFIYIDPAGRTLANAYAMDNGPDYFQEGIARIVENRKIGFMTDHGRIVVPPRFERASSFCHGHAEVMEGGVTYSIDTGGRRMTRRSVQ